MSGYLHQLKLRELLLREHLPAYQAENRLCRPGSLGRTSAGSPRALADLEQTLTGYRLPRGQQPAKGRGHKVMPLHNY